ncbi:hypothetical protein MRX96_054829 [Rhipicephalus microplus]
MTELGVSLAAVSDPYRPGKKLPSPPPGFQLIAVERDPVVAIIMQKAPFDICPLLVSERVVAIYCEANDTDFVFTSAYAPPHKSMEPTLVLVERVLAWLRTRNIIVAGDFNAKHSAWGAQASDPRGSRLVEFAAATGLVLLNHSSSIPTYENKYSMSWIDVTFATPPTIAAGYSWSVHEDVTYSEHRYLEIAIGRDAATRNKRLTWFAREQLLEALSREPWFDRVMGAQLQSADALELVVSQFYQVSERYRRKYLRPAHPTRRGIPGGRRNWHWSESA